MHKHQYLRVKTSFNLYARAEGKKVYFWQLTRFRVISLEKKIVMNTNRTSSGVPMHCEVLADRKLNRTHVLIHQSAEKPNPAETEHNE